MRSSILVGTKNCSIFSHCNCIFILISEINYNNSVSLSNENINPKLHKTCITSLIEQKSPWPIKVSCEMSVENWILDLEEFDLMGKYGFLIEGFRNGFHQGIPQHSIMNLNWYCPPNHSSALKVQEKIQKNIDKEVAASRMFGPYTKDEVYRNMGFFRTSPLGAVEKGDKSLRPINDFSFPRNDPTIPSVNSFVDKEKFTTTWDDFKFVANYLKNLKEDCLIGIFDWEGAYRQIPTHPSQWAYLAVLGFEEEVYIDTRIAFGGVAGCGSFGGPADGWKKIMKAKFNLLRILRWVDDNLCIKLVSSSVSMLDLVKASEKLGVKTNSTKYSEFKDKQAFIGFIWNVKQKTVGLSIDKLLKRRNEVDTFWSKLSWSKNELEKMNGKLNHLTLILPQMKPYLTANFRWLAGWTRPVKMKAPEDVLNDMAFWRQTLTTLKPTRLIPDTIEWNIGWVGDASTDFGIGIIIGRYWSQFKWLDGWKTPTDGPRRSIAWAETVAVRLGLMMASVLHDVRGRTLSMLSDNTTTNGVVRNQRSRDQWVNQEWKLIQSLLIELDCGIEPHYVKSKDNEADALSRGLDPSKASSKCIKLAIPVDLSHLITQVLP